MIEYYKEFWRKKKIAATKGIIGVFLFCILSLIMFWSFAGKNLGILSLIVGLPIPLGCVVLGGLILWSSNELFKKAPAWSPPSYRNKK